MVLLGVGLALVAGGAAAIMESRRPDYSRVEALRAEQDAEGTHDEHVRQRYFRRYKAHPDNAMYIYLWARCVDDAAEQLRLGEEGIKADPKFSWSYNIAARALARLGRVEEARSRAAQGAELDPGNMQLRDKLASLTSMLDQKLADEPRPAPTAYVKYDKDRLEKEGVRYTGLFRNAPRADRADLQAIEASRGGDSKSGMGDALRSFSLCANPYADVCTRVYVPRDARLGDAWPAQAPPLGELHENQLVTATGAVVTTSRGENILLADYVNVSASASEHVKEKK
jgi:tetratricopeptide (TPR) repeat protein